MPRPAPLRFLARLTLLLWAAATGTAMVWALAHHPLAQPFIARTDAEIRTALTRAMAGAVTPDWITPQLEAAIAADDPDRVTMLLDLAQEHATPLPEGLRPRAEAVLAAHQGLWQTTHDCGACMIDIAHCPRLSLIGACALPFELSPAGDVNELRRQGVAWWQGDEVDAISTGLASVGLAATVLTIPSMGASAPIKAGAAALRLARRADALSPRLTADLGRAARETGGMARLTAMAEDATRIAVRAGPAQTLDILRHADDAQDLRRLARLSEAAGPQTGRALDVLGKARSLRLLHRLGDMLVLTLGLLMTLCAQLGGLAAVLLKLALRRLTR
ncbi:MAG TPA: hypothetical protein VGC31_01915 [Paenirhodobacter sp.]